jgi:hypothetical protein
MDPWKDNIFYLTLYDTDENLDPSSNDLITCLVTHSRSSSSLVGQHGLTPASAALDFLLLKNHIYRSLGSLTLGIVITIVNQAS